jgi:hypothetical protein
MYFLIVFCISVVIDVASTNEEPRYKWGAKRGCFKCWQNLKLLMQGLVGYDSVSRILHWRLVSQLFGLVIFGWTASFSLLHYAMRWFFTCKLLPFNWRWMSYMLFLVHLCLALFIVPGFLQHVFGFILGQSFVYVRLCRIGRIEILTGLSDTSGFTQTGSGSNPGRNSILWNRRSLQA